ncbi:MAG: transporter substrate-binding domain-containing protein [Pseudomonas sp.]|uniref:substrate-binding periplasmic protein n=1 Tax=Pseudomonas sp. TaxID=306 RepID=UPI0027326889|nr:transporter substrate-binding domain-containing protein [Pseudomonas sp.]MDP3847497.1 transporter substrate-binding domain-containing protein [Pseudomonas sp.]
MRKLLNIGLGFCLYWAAVGFAATPIPVSILCDEGYPPYSYGENGQALGLYSDILRAAFARMPAYQVSIRPVPWKRGLLLLERGSAFALYPPYLRQQERPWMDYSRAILEEKVVIFVNPTTTGGRALADFPAAYAGLRIGQNAGFSVIHNPLFQQMLEHGQLSLESGKDNRSNLLKFSLGRIDAYVNDRLSALWTWQQLLRSGEIKPHASAVLVEGPTLSIEHGYLGFTNRDQGKFGYKADFIRSLNAALVELEREGVIEQLSTGYSTSLAP